MSKGIKTADGVFTCYPDGRIQSNKTGNFVGWVDTTGYVMVQHPNGKKILAHRLIASVFLGLDLLSDLTVDHLNRIKTDNRVSNLEVVTLAENARRANIRHSTTKESVVLALAKYRTWDSAARNLGFSNGGSLYTYCSKTLGTDPKTIAREAGVYTNKDKIRELRDMPLEEFNHLMHRHGGAVGLAKLTGVNVTTIRKLKKEKLCN